MRSENKMRAMIVLFTYHSLPFKVEETENFALNTHNVVLLLIILRRVVNRRLMEVFLETK